MELTDEEFEVMLRATNRLHQLQEAEAKMNPAGKGMSRADALRGRGR